MGCAKHPPIRRGGGAARAVQHPLEEGSRKEPRRLRTAQRHPPLTRREARSPQQSRPHVSETVLDRIVSHLKESLAYNANAHVEPVALLGRTKARNGSRSSTESASGCRSCALVTTTQRAARAGVLGPLCRPGTVDAGPGGWSADRVSAGSRPQRAASCRYVPGGAGPNSRASVPEPVVLAPEREGLVGRSLFSHSDRGLGLHVADDADTGSMMLLALDRLLHLPVDRLRTSCSTPISSVTSSTRIPSGACSAGSTIPPGFRPRLDDANGRRSCSSARRTTVSIRLTDGAITAARKLGESEGMWAQVWKRFAELPQRYPGIPERLRQAKPLELFSSSAKPGRRTTRLPRTSCAIFCWTSLSSPPKARARRR